MDTPTGDGTQYGRERTDPPEVRNIPIELVYAEPQLRQSFDDEKIAELERSIEGAGLLHAIGVRPTQDGRYCIIYGERRYRALLRAGASHIPAHVRDADRGQALLMQLIENIQKADLTPMETAIGIKKVKDEFGLNLSELERKLGKPRTTLREYLKLLHLVPELQALVDARKMPVVNAKYAADLGTAQQLATIRYMEAIPLPGRVEFRRLCAMLQNTEGGSPDVEAQKIEQVLERAINDGCDLRGIPRPPSSREQKASPAFGGPPPGGYPEKGSLPEVPPGRSPKVRMQNYIFVLSASSEPEEQAAALVLGRFYNSLWRTDEQSANADQTEPA